MYIIFLRRLIQALMSGGGGGGVILPVMITGSVMNVTTYASSYFVGSSLNKILFFCDGIEMSSYSGVTLDNATGTITFPIQITGEIKILVQPVGAIPVMVTDSVSDVNSYMNIALVGKTIDEILFFCDGIELSSYAGVTLTAVTGTINFPIQITGEIKIIIY